MLSFLLQMMCCKIQELGKNFEGTPYKYYYVVGKPKFPFRFCGTNSYLLTYLVACVLKTC